MATKGRRPAASVIERLREEPYRFDFFQAVRLLETQARQKARDDRIDRPSLVGEDGDPRREPLRFSATPSLSFPSASITAFVDEPSDRAPPTGAPPPRMSVSFLGLTGPSGVLPQHYTEALIRAARAKSPSLREFFDIFNHRTVSLFYRAWCKYRFVPSYEESDGDGSDPLSRILEAVIGLASGRLRRRLAVDDQALFHYAGLFGGKHRSATGLEQLLSDYFGQPVNVRQFQGQWLPIAVEERSALPSRELPKGAFCQLGVNAVIGERSYDVTSNFALALGPLDYTQFSSFMPDGDDFKQMVELTQLYVGSDLDFTVELTLAKDEVPTCQLVSEGAYQPRLGCNAWLKSEPFRHDVTDAVFAAAR